MKTVRPDQLPYEDVSFFAVSARCFEWPAGNTTWYHGPGRPDNMLFYTLHGARRYRQDELTFTVGAGDLMLMPSGSCYHNVVISSDGTKGICLQFAMRDSSGAPCRLGERLGVLAHDSDGHICQMLEKLLAASLQKGGRLRAQELLIRLLEEVCPPPEMGPDGDAELYPAVLYMERHLQSPSSVAALAALCHMSESTFSRRFRNSFGCPPALYHRRLRLDKSLELLESGLYTVEQAAATLGFFDAAHFSRCFRARFGLSAGSIRRST